MHTTLIILAAGTSSRMNKSLVTSNLSKALIGIDESGRPILDYVLMNAKQAGYQNIYVVVGEDSEGFKTNYGSQVKDNDFNGLNLSYATQYIPNNRTKPFGTADALLQTLEQYHHLQKDSFTVCNCDNLYSINAFRALKNSKASNAFIGYDRNGLQFSSERISKFALVHLDRHNYLVNIIEKPKTIAFSKFKDSAGTLRVSMNIFKLNGTDIYPFLKNCPVNPERDEKELPTAILNMCKTIPNAMLGIPFNEHVPDLTSKEDITVLKNYIKAHFKA
jgi:glucose-1-phosphate adenylyltransferase